MKADDIERKIIIKELISILIDIEIIYTLEKYTSKSNVCKSISLYILKSHELLCIDDFVGKILWGVDGKYGGCKIYGIGIDPGKLIVYKLSQALYVDGNKLKQQWL